MVFNLYLPKGTGGLPPTGKTLEQYSWDEISKISKKGKASEYGFQTGQTKSIMFNGVQYYVQIIGFDHDDVVDVASYGRDKAGITFQFGVANDPAKAGMYSQTYPMNSSNTNSGGWESCLMRTSTMPEMKDYLPTELQSLIVKVNKKTSAGNKSSSINTSQDELWLLSEVEIFGTTSFSFAGEGEQYQFYKDGKSKVRYNTSGSTNYWWERSPFFNNSTYFCFVYNNGTAAYNYASSTYGVSFGFCI